MTTFGITDLTNANLTGVKLSYADLRHADLTGVMSGRIDFGSYTPPKLPTNWQVIDGYLIGPGADRLRSVYRAIDSLREPADLSGCEPDRCAPDRCEPDRCGPDRCEPN